MIRLWALVFSLLCAPAFAGYASAIIGGGAFKQAGGTYAVKGASATAANGAFITPATVTAAGQLVTMPGSATFAANAASFAVSAVRLNPAGLMVSLTASWLIGKGLDYANGQWTKTSSGETDATGNVGFAWYGYDSAANYGSWEAAATGTQNHPAIHGTGWTYQYGSVPSIHVLITGRGAGYSDYPATINRRSYCFSGYTLNAGLCVPNAVTVPATEADFTQAGTGALPDDVAQQLARADVPIPVNQPVLNPAPVQIDSTPYLDPISGRMVTERSVFTPSPTADNPLQVRMENYQTDAGAVPGQTAAPVAPTKEASISNQPLNIQFPSDYARQGEAQSAAQSVTDALGPKIDKITETGADPVDPAAPQGSAFDAAFFQGTFTNLLGWQLPAHSSLCPTSSFAFNGSSYTVDSHCQLVANHFSALSTVMTVVWTVLALFILLGA